IRPAEAEAGRLRHWHAYLPLAPALRIEPADAPPLPMRPPQKSLGIDAHPVGSPPRRRYRGKHAAVFEVTCGGIVVVGEDIPTAAIDEIEDAVIQTPIHSVCAHERAVELAAGPVDIDAVERAGGITIGFV